MANEATINFSIKGSLHAEQRNGTNLTAPPCPGYAVA